MKRTHLFLKYSIFLLAVCVLFMGCGENTAEGAYSDGTEPSVSEDTGYSEDTEAYEDTKAPEKSADDEALTDCTDSVFYSMKSGDMFTDRDNRTTYDESECVLIILSDDGITSDSSSVITNDNTVTITQEGEYILTGNLTDGMIIVDAKSSDKVRLILNGVSVTSTDSAAIYVRQADKVFVTLADGSVNTLANGGSYNAIDDNNIDAVIFSKDDLTLNGTGDLTVNAVCGHGIVSKDDLAVTSGNYTITAEGHALSGKDSIRIGGGTFILNSGNDALHAENNSDSTLGFICIEGGTFTIDSSDDAFNASSDILITGGDLNITAADDAFHSDYILIISGGTIDIVSCYEGLEAFNIYVEGGDISIVSSDDAVNSARVRNINYSSDEGEGTRSFDSLLPLTEISGGKLTIFTKGDGIDSNGNLLISGGETYISGPSSGMNGSLDFNAQGKITGGVFVAGGSSQMADIFDTDSEQGYIKITGQYYNPGTTVSLTDNSDGKTLVDWVCDSSFNLIIISCPEIKKGASLYFTVGDEELEIEMTQDFFSSYIIPESSGSSRNADQGSVNESPENNREQKRGTPSAPGRVHP